jgi:Ca2+:H+ antiporter
LRATFGAWSSLLFIAVPVGFVLNYMNYGPTSTFVVNFIAMAPSIALIIFAIDEVGLYLGDKMGNLLSMTFR